MSQLKFPIIECEGNKFQVLVDLQLYSKETIVASIYNFTNQCAIHQQIVDDSDDKVLITFESKDENIIDSKLPKLFCNTLIDEQVRQNINMQFGMIRDMIVKEAFKPVTK